MENLIYKAQDITLGFQFKDTGKQTWTVVKEDVFNDRVTIQQDSPRGSTCTLKKGSLAKNVTDKTYQAVTLPKEDTRFISADMAYGLKFYENKLEYRIVAVSEIAKEVVVNIKRKDVKMTIKEVVEKLNSGIYTRYPVKRMYKIY